ncbi:hybrid sensor histidine kinase/response regulator [Halobacterium jilantaiense]|uniref:histidine kinase n=1 Tax=Halobacterium jilantaiense TaxID=355548 RepID=A0A1I0QBI5_9EURY|nr:PAS domain S-box protein [Halobacterium jilantaiense]SEW24405.1 PAS domain S-box-containing protein [Halobacterium jilantaiense]
MTTVSGDPIVVLLVEDDDALADLTATYLEREDDDFDVTTRPDAESALEYLGDATVDCIVSDHDMPGMNGLEFLEVVREAHSELPFMLFTGKGDEEIASDAISAGVTDYLQKDTGTDQYTVLANRVRNAVEKRRSQTALREEKHLLEQVLATTPGSVVFQPDGRVASATDRAQATLGLKDAQFPADPDWTLADLDGDPLGGNDHPARRVADSGQPLHGERLAVVFPDGWEKYLVMHCAPIFDDDGGVDRVVASFTDITDRVRRERELARVQTIVQAVGDPVYTTDEDGVITFVNDAFEELSGRDRDDLVGSHSSTLMTDDDFAEGTRVVSRLMKGDGESATVSLTGEHWADGVDHLDVHVGLLPEDGGFRGTAGVVRDVTEQRRRERKLRESEEKYATVVEEANDGVFVAQDGVLKFANSEGAAILDSDPESLEGTPVADVVAPEYRETVLSRLERRLAGGDPERRYEFEALTTDGDRTPIEFTAATITYEDDPAVLAICRDVADRRERERQRRRAETIVETAPDAVFILDEAANYVDGNRQAADLLGLPYDELSDHSVPELVDDGIFEREVVPRYRETVAALLSSDNDHDKGKFEFRVHPADGDETRVVECHLALRPHDGDFRGAIGVLRDVTERNRRRRELEAQNERLDEFASVVSHDLRSPLNVATGWLQRYRQTGDEDTLVTVEESLDRVDEILDELLTLARDGPDSRDPEAVPLQDAAAAAWNAVDTGDANVDIDTDDCRVTAVPSRLQELFENLFRNAVEHGSTDHASRTPESVVPSERPVQPDGAFRESAAVTVRVGELDDRRGFYVADDGPGIRETNREDVFEMGYTTTTSGTGFGLAIVATTAENHGWDVTLTESADGGARFEFET